MPHALIARNDDLKRLKESGHTLRLVDCFLVVEDVPYVCRNGTVQEAELVIPLELSADTTMPPRDHTAFWTGGFPYNSNGTKLVALGEANQTGELSDGKQLRYMFSAKPDGGKYRDYDHKVRTYIEILGREARNVDPTVTARKWKVDVASGRDDIFEYMETASARQNTSDLARKVEGERVAIVGIGGTGSYVLDFVAKSWVSAIHLYDDDRYLQHNAFRAPGATEMEDLKGGPTKAEFHAARYSRMRRGVVGFPVRIDDNNVVKLAHYDTVFLCIDGSVIKKSILELCDSQGSVCIDTGMGLFRNDDKLGGIIRVTTSAPGQRLHIAKHRRIDMDGQDGPGEYERNLQMVELNALNAALAVVKWKKIRGIYQDLQREGDSGYIVDGNRLVNRDQME